VKINFCPVCGQRLQSRLIDAVARLACESPTCGFVHWNNPIPVVAALVQVGDRYVLARNVRWPANTFSVVTGFVEEGESPETAVVREATEELGLHIEAHTFIGYFPLRVRNQLIIAFALSGTGVLQPGHEIAETKVVSHAELAQYDFGPLLLTRDIVASWLRMSLNHHSRK
jgi:NADH pyrophosphatase NudC (nudix superfamily)